MANEVRAGLEAKVAVAVNSSSKVSENPLDEIWVGKTVRRHVKEFGAVFATLFLIICASKILKGYSAGYCSLWFGLAVVTAVLGYFVPSVLRPVWRAWMKLAHYLSIVTTSILLGVIWFVGFLPMAGIVRICGIKVVDKRYGVNVGTYWVKRDPKFDDFSRLKQQY